MGTAIGVGIGVGIGSSSSWKSYWKTQAEVLFFGEISKITDGKLYNQKTGSIDYLTVGGSVGSYTFQCPQTDAYKNADSDELWFKYSTKVLRTVTEAELVGYDFTRTIVKYDNTSPYAIRHIVILSENVDTARMRNDFDLSIWWSNILSLYGNIKGNRGVGKSTWTPDNIVDADGNIYTLLVIGAQTWLLENLKTTKYNDGSPIPTGLSDANWALEDGSAGHDGAFSYPNNSSANKAIYGLLYNFSAVVNAKGMAPVGCHIATDADYQTLQTYLGGSGVASGKMKEAGTTHWTTPNTGATNESGFTALPAGRRTQVGAYSLFGTYGIYWESTSYNATNAYRRYMVNTDDNLATDYTLKLNGFSVRCLLD